MPGGSDDVILVRMRFGLFSEPCPRMSSGCNRAALQAGAAIARDLPRVRRAGRPALPQRGDDGQPGADADGVPDLPPDRDDDGRRRRGRAAARAAPGAVARGGRREGRR